MKSTFKLIRRFVKVLLLSFIGLMLLNIALFVFVVSRSESNSGGWKAAEQLGNELAETESGAYTLSEKGGKFCSRGTPGRFWSRTRPAT